MPFFYFLLRQLFSLDSRKGRGATYLIGKCLYIIRLMEQLHKLGERADELTISANCPNVS